MLLILFFSFALLLIIGTPVAFSMGLASLIALLEHGKIPIELVPQRFFTSMDSFSLIAIPLFVLAGELMNSGGITRRIVKFSSTLVGHLRGGLAQVTVLASMIFAGISGSAAADASAIGSVLIPTMVEEGYDKDYAVAVVACSSTMGPIIPPSILMIIYGSMTGLSIGSLFLGGIIPGVMIGISIMIIAYYYARKRGYKSRTKATFRERWLAFRQAAIALVMPIIILGGILSGVFTATEAGVVAVVYALIVGLVLKELKLKDMKHILVDSAITTSITLLIIAAASLFGWLLATEQFPQLLAQNLMSITNNTSIILLLLIGMLLIIGLFIEGLAALIILVPVLAPMAIQFGFDPIHFAVLVIVVILIGAVTPPVGLLLFIAASIAKIKLSEASRIIWPFVGAMIVVALLIAFIPSLVTFIPRLFL